MSTMMIHFPKSQVSELKTLVEDGLHIFGKVMGIAERMCEGTAFGERYGDRYGAPMPYGHDPYMAERYHHMRYPY